MLRKHQSLKLTIGLLGLNNLENIWFHYNGQDRILAKIGLITYNFSYIDTVR